MRTTRRDNASWSRYSKISRTAASRAFNSLASSRSRKFSFSYHTLDDVNARIRARHPGAFHVAVTGTRVSGSVTAPTGRGQGPLPTPPGR